MKQSAKGRVSGVAETRGPGEHRKETVMDKDMGDMKESASGVGSEGWRIWPEEVGQDRRPPWEEGMKCKEAEKHETCIGNAVDV